MTGYLRFWGVRGSYPAPFDSHLGVGGNTSCVEIRWEDDLVVCDAGTGIIPLGNALMEQAGGDGPEAVPPEVNVFLTHYHWDHISGLPFFVPAFVPGWTIRFHGPGNDDGEVERNISDQMKAPYFPVETETWLADIEYRCAREQAWQIGGVRLEPFNVHHPGSTYGYRIEVGGSTIVYASDNELAFIDRSIDARKAEFDEKEQRLLEEMREEERSRALEFMDGVDILIHDAQYTPEDYERKRGWGHSCYIDTVNAAVEAGVKELYLFHLDPAYDDAAVARLHEASEALIARKGGSLRCHIAREGMQVPLAGARSGSRRGQRRNSRPERLRRSVKSPVRARPGS